ncbi:hypothetical protein F5876DRAFT_23572, partial [Lentinula aff. lateritia]
ECCFLKMLTLIIDRRLREYAEDQDLLPSTQNGFRPGYRTTNNPFILKTMVDTAKAMGKPLYVAYMDWTHAFPLTNRPMMWMKLNRMGIRGPLID